MAIELSPLLKETIAILAAKRKMLRDHQDDIRTLVVGSSHGDFGFNPDYCASSFNLCCRSQDLRHSHAIYKRMAGSLPSLQNLVIFYSIFSPGGFMDRSPSERDICPPLNEMFELGVDYEDEYLSGMSRALRPHLGEISADLPGTRGFLYAAGKGFMSAAYGAEKRAADHLKLNKNNEANLHLLKSLLLAKSLGHRTFVVIPPVRSDYRAAIGRDYAYLFRGLREIQEEFDLGYQFEIINCLDDSAFSDDHFGDYDHMRPTGEGVAILSNKIAEAVSRSTPA